LEHFATLEKKIPGALTKNPGAITGCARFDITPGADTAKKRKPDVRDASAKNRNLKTLLTMAARDPIHGPFPKVAIPI
jgi:hypothetical protein